MVMSVIDFQNPNKTARIAGIPYIFPFILSFLAIFPCSIDPESS